MIPVLRFIRAALVALIFTTFLMAFFGQAGAVAPPMQWSDAKTFYGPTSKPITLIWQDTNVPQANRYELRAFWLERPSKSPITWNLLSGNYVRNGTTVSKQLQAPGAGSFTFEVRNCFAGTPEFCTAWSQSLDPLVSKVRDAPGAWQVYFYIEAPGSVITLPAAGPEK